MARDEKGRFIKGSSGNPGGRTQKTVSIEEYGKTAPEELIKIANSSKTPVKVKADIWKWFAEMTFGKPKPLTGEKQSETTAQGNAIKFEGDLEKWSE